MGRKCTPDPTITVIRDLNAPVMRRMRTRSLVGGLSAILVTVLLLLCQLGGSDCYSVGGSDVSGGPSDKPFVVNGPRQDLVRNDESSSVLDRDANDVATNEVEEVQKTCDR